MVWSRFVTRFVLLLTLFIITNAFIWFGWVKEIVAPGIKGGDLVRMGYISGLRVKRQNIVDLPIRHIDIRDYNKTPVDIVTIGDSFSVGGGYGKNRFYQDYIASNNKLSVLNVPSYINKGAELQFQPLLTLAKLVNSGYFDIMTPKYIIVETVERQALERFEDISVFDTNDTISGIDSYFKELNTDPSEGVEIRSFINNANFKFLYNTARYRAKEQIRGSKVVKTKLTKPMFSSPYGKQLIFYEDDISNAVKTTPARVVKLNENLNFISDVLRRKGITLVFMPIVDKFDLYSEYIVTKTYPQTIFFETLRTLPKRYQFIDTKKILSISVAAGERDIYFQDDTHWTWKAAEIVFREVKFEVCTK